VIDLHCHILPELDDGPETLQESVEMARTAVADGFTQLVATPHISRAYPATTGLRIAEGVLLLNRALREADVELTVRPGAEVALRHVAELEDGELRRLRLGAGPWMLVECPSTGSASDLEAALDTLAAREHRILLAHPERIQGFRDDRALLIRLVSQGMLCQLTAGSLVGRFGSEVERFARRLASDGLIHIVASDAHSAADRPPSVRRELQEAGFSEDGVRFVTLEAPQAMLAGEPVPMPPPLLAERRPRRLPRRTP